MPEILIFSDKIISLSYYLRTNKIDTSPLTQSISPTVQSEDPTASISPPREIRRRLNRLPQPTSIE